MSYGHVPDAFPGHPGPDVGSTLPENYTMQKCVIGCATGEGGHSCIQEREEKTWGKRSGFCGAQSR